MNDDVARRSAVLIERISRLVNLEAQAEGLLPVQWEALRYLDKANRFSRTAASLTAYLGLTKGTVSQTLKALQAKRLIRKQVDPKDRRSNRLTLTAKGRQSLSKDPLTSTASAIAGLPERSQTALARGLGQLLTVGLSAQGRQPFGPCHNCVYFGEHHPEGKPHYCRLLKEILTDADSEAICHEQQPKGRQ